METKNKTAVILPVYHLVTIGKIQVGKSRTWKIMLSHKI